MQDFIDLVSSNSIGSITYIKCRRKVGDNGIQTILVRWFSLSSNVDPEFGNYFATSSGISRPFIAKITCAPHNG